MTNYYTENFADMGARERGLLMDILKAWNDNGLPENFDESNVRPAFNKGSGNVFLVNDDCQVAMMNGDKLEEFYNTPYEGHEGFISDLLELDPYSLNVDDVQYIIDIWGGEDTPFPENWQKYIREEMK